MRFIGRPYRVIRELEKLLEDSLRFNAALEAALRKQRRVTVDIKLTRGLYAVPYHERRIHVQEVGGPAITDQIGDMSIEIRLEKMP